MAVTKLIERRVEKVWGRRDLPTAFGPVATHDEPVGEIWFEHPAGVDMPLLIKYLFTSEKLSVQVHPDDEAAAKAGRRRGKEEAWIVLGAEPGATIGIGLRHTVSKERLRAAALDGSIERLLDWRPAAAGDFYYSPAGTVHALGPGLTLIEVQQNVDLTYRLYDYGRPRELHLDEAIEAADPIPYEPPMRPYPFGEGREILADGRAFVLERWSGPASARIVADKAAPIWLIPTAPGGEADGQSLEPGTVWIADDPALLSLAEGADLLLAYPGPSRRKFDKAAS
jgi:mannose-6-phosphate isomerase